jgi:hypothetical protein
MPDDSWPSDLVPPGPGLEPTPAVDPRSPGLSPPTGSDPATGTVPHNPTDAATWAPPGPPADFALPDLSHWPPPRPLAPPDPSVATGPPWPRLVASPGSGYRPPRSIRWPIVVGCILFAASIASYVVGIVSTPKTTRSASPYVLTAADAGFTATFPGKPQRVEKTAATGSVLLYVSSLSDEAVGVAYFPVTSSSGFSLDGAVNGAATSLAGGKVVSRSTVIYQGQAAEDGVLSFNGGIGNVRAVVFGSAAYLFEGFGPSRSDFARDYNVLLATFQPNLRSGPATTSPPASTPESPTSLAPAGTGSLGSKIVPAPSGFSLFQESGVQNGPLTSAGFDSFVAAPGASTQLHYVTGYQVNYGDIQSGDVINVTLLEFASASDAANFEDNFAVDGTKTSSDPTVPGGEVYDSTTATAGSYEHGVIATKGNAAMIVDYGSGSSTRPALLDELAAQQYARI